MKALNTILFLFIICISITAQNIDGTWKGTMSGPNGETELVFNFVTDGDNLTGNVSSPMGEIPIENGKIDGDKFSFDVNVNGMAINHDCVLDGDVINMSVPFMDQTMEIVLKKEESKSKINGTWIGNVSSPQGDMEITYEFIVNGNELTGKDTSPMGTLDIVNGVVDGNKFSFDIEMQGMKIGHKCTYLEDDTIDMLVDVMGQESLVKLNRAEK